MLNEWSLFSLHLGFDDFIPYSLNESAESLLTWSFLLSLLPGPAPPSDPRIPAPSTGYPFLAGSTSVSLTCVSDTPGYPSASYTWTRTAGGRPGSGGTLTFDTVTSDLHNRTVSCRASNDFTVDKDRPLVEASRRLQVYCEYRDRACGR